MKPLLRVVLMLDALVLLAFGLLFLLTPWTSLYDALQLAQTEPALVGQVFGVALVGLAWLALHASFDGALTTKVAKVVGHVHWLTGVLMLVWLIGLRTPLLTGFGQVVAVSTAVALVVIGLGGVRLSGAVRRREKGIVDKTAVTRADRRAAKAAGKEAEKEAARRRELEREPRVTAGFPAYHAEPAVEPVMPAAPATRPVNPASPVSPTSPVTPAAAAPLRPAVDEAGLTESERAARNAAAEAAGAPRPPLHG
ncbi:conserved membrane hypothetical protein [Paraburkholderia ribeironis]|uniref:Transmembrane protein n=1 Tax=Paraburkholderia ribeironis TaxID=1247936 RepID=A0A1N7RR11_9BURK|nr:hypothetical protein [Paraburkholderia ribeironis]SIT37565.1 conserved membrane hypothetical protein [Paraburkholderia ribeironis]